MTVEERLALLERTNRRLKVGVGLLLLSVFAGTLLGFAHQDTTPDVIEAKAFHVVTDDGTVLLKLEDTFGIGMGLGGTVTTLSGEGKKLVLLAGSSGGGVVTTFNELGQELVMLGATTEGEGKVSTLDPSGIRGAGTLSPQ